MKFQQYWPGTFDGYELGFDAVAIVPTTFADDWYRFTLADGQWASAALHGPAADAATLELYDADAQLLATAIVNLDGTFSLGPIIDTTTDGQPAEHFVRVAGVQSDYELLVARHPDGQPSVESKVVGRHLYYHGSSLDAGGSLDAALPPDKMPLLAADVRPLRVEVAPGWSLHRDEATGRARGRRPPSEAHESRRFYVPWQYWHLGIRGEFLAVIVANG